MLGLRILLHSVRLLLQNWPAALHISAPFIALVVVFNLLFEGGSLNFALTSKLADIPWLTYFLGVVAYLIITAWVAVGWHRYVLIEEGGDSFVPEFVPRRLWGYFLQGILLGLILLVAALLYTLTIGILWQPLVEMRELMLQCMR